MSRARVLVVDDEEDVRASIMDLLQLEGYDVDGAVDGDTAIERVGRAPFDLVTLDLRMPGMDSKEALAELRRICPHAHVVVISGYASDADASACLALGAFAVVHKPFEVAALLGVVERALQSSGVRDSV